ncbi:hypothetical protein BDR07DRAFT_1456106 [Suillus spraguei]|nr:hypothetical protein BDR07DRAFT_1456106 [Suillus spraguei]
MLFHGDLGTGECLQAALQQHAIESTPWNCLQHVIFIPGLFHLKMANVGILRPKETGIYGLKPGFCRMHQLITYSGICRCLDCWRVEVKKSVPSHEYVADHRLRRMRSKDVTQHDGEYENALLLNKYMLLYEELSYAMNIGDIGRVEMCIIAWILIFKATGKHKYATHMSDFLSNVHFLI